MPDMEPIEPAARFVRKAIESAGCGSPANTARECFVSKDVMEGPTSGANLTLSEKDATRICERLGITRHDLVRRGAKIDFGPEEEGEVYE